jgi:chorismate mutase
LDVEAAILGRVSQKVEQLQAKADSRIRHIIDADAVIGFYRDHVIPLTKKGEVLYLLNRSGME